MEELLNKLIEKDWKPFGDKDIAEIHKDYGTERFYFEYEHYPVSSEYFYLRHLTSKESGLWQFVCENELYPQYIQHRWFRDLPTNGLQPHDYRYWVIESALREELELERFLLDNIKVDD